MNFRYYDDEGKWIWLTGAEDIITTEEMVKLLTERQRAYVVNHIGYKAYVQKNADGELIWSLPSQNYKSEFYVDDFDGEIKNDLLWIIL